MAAFNKRDLATLVDDLLAVADDDPGVYKISAREEVKVRHERNTRTLFEELGGEQLTLAEGYWNPSSGQDAEGRYNEALFRTNRDGTFVSVWRLKTGTAGPDQTYTVRAVPDDTGNDAWIITDISS